MKRNHIIIVLTVVVCGILSACEDVILKDVQKDREVVQKTDTLARIDKYMLDSALIRTSADLPDNKAFSSVNIYLDGDDLYVANFTGKCVDLFDAVTMEYKRSYSKDARTLARDIYVEGDHLFVAAGDSREVQIFNKNTGDYLTRLGTGVWTGNVSYAGNVAATGRFIFVRDSKATNIRVFDREQISLTAANNNSPYASVGIETHYIDQQLDSYDMEVIGDSLYVFLHRPNPSLIYAYSIADIEEKKNSAPFVKTELGDGNKIYSIAYNKESDDLHVSMQKGGARVIEKITLADFLNRDFSKPVYSFSSARYSSFSQTPMIAFLDGKLFFPAGSKLEQWTIVNMPSYIIKPVE